MKVFFKPYFVSIYTENLYFHGTFTFQCSGKIAYKGLADMMAECIYFYFLV
ncbi:MAG: hypothetical protein WBH08_05470 [Methanothrix sp.]|jgi:hypothetical protein|uniref:hypothetical protein n=1 Tax=Methanothrix sp. TaxID=90426 RepID=UPI003BB705AD